MDLCEIYVPKQTAAARSRSLGDVMLDYTSAERRAMSPQQHAPSQQPAFANARFPWRLPMSALLAGMLAALGLWYGLRVFEDRSIYGDFVSESDNRVSAIRSEATIAIHALESLARFMPVRKRLTRTSSTRSSRRCGRANWVLAPSTGLPGFQRPVTIPG